MGFGVVRVVGEGETMCLKLGNGVLQLGNRRADVGQLDDVGFGLEHELAEGG